MGGRAAVIGPGNDHVTLNFLASGECLPEDYRKYQVDEYWRLVWQSVPFGKVVAIDRDEGSLESLKRRGLRENVEPVLAEMPVDGRFPDLRWLEIASREKYGLVLVPHVAGQYAAKQDYPGARRAGCATGTGC